MRKCKYLILGAGPAGLSLANYFKYKGQMDFIILEKESVAGGLCRSRVVDESPLDIGGGHFLDVRRPEVNSFLFSFLPENEWNVFVRDSRIQINDQMISHPLEANIWQMDADTQIKYIISIAKAGCVRGSDMPTLFIDWIRWKLGDEIANSYMIPYNKKMFGDELNQLGTYWLNKLPDVSFEDVLRSCIEHKAYAKQPGHASFLYPKNYGYGELWIRMAQSICERIVYNSSVTSIDFNNRRVYAVDGTVYEAEVIITTVPWTSIADFVGMPEKVADRVKHLKHTGVVISYCGDNLDTEAHWIYNPNPEKAFHRILVRPNFLPGSRGYWKETRKERFRDIGNEVFFENEYAYPLNTVDKPVVMRDLMTWAETKKVYALGRWGEHEHYNSDVVVERAINLGKMLLAEEHFNK